MKCQVKKTGIFNTFLFAFNRRSMAATAVRDICAVHGEGAMAERTAHDWHAKLNNGNFDLKDTPCYGCLVEFDE